MSNAASTAPAGASSARSLFRGMAVGSGLYLLPVVVQRLASVFLLPITTRYLTPSDYGIADLLEQVATVLYVLLGISFSSALGYFYFESDSAARRRAVVSTTMIGAGTLGVLIGAAGWPFAAALSRAVFGDLQADGYLRLVFLSLPFAFLLECLLAWLRVEDRARAFAAASVLRVLLTAAGLLLLVAYLQWHVWGVLTTSVAVMVILSALLGVVCFHRVGLSFDWGLFRRMARFAAPIGISGMGMFIIHFGARFVLPHYRSFADLGIYALAVKLGMMIGVPYLSFHTWWSAQVYNVMRRDDADLVLARTITYVCAGIAWCAVGLAVFTRPMLRILAAPAYQAAGALVAPIIAAYALKSIGDFFRCLFLAEGRPGLDAVCTWTGAAICLCGYLAVVPAYGVKGAILTTLATFFLIAVLSIVWTYRLRPYRVEGARLVKVALAMTVPLAAHAAAPSQSLALQVAWAAALSVSFPAILWMLRFLTPGELAIVRNSARKVIGR